jgi:hypothetical protein
MFAEPGHSPFWEEADRFNHEVSTSINGLDGLESGRWTEHP